MKKSLVLTTLGFLSLGPTQVVPQEDNAAYRDGYGFILEENWAEAQRVFSQFQQDWPESPWRDDAAFWNCFATENATTLELAQFQCYETFLQQYPQSSWASDAVSKAVVLGTQLSARGYPGLLEQITFPTLVDPDNPDIDINFDDDYDFDYDFDFDSDEISESVERALRQAEREMQRVQRRLENMELPVLPDLPELADGSIVVELDDVRNTLRDIQVVRRGATLNVRNRSRNTADDELLTILAALRNDQRASDLLIQHLDNSSNPELRARIVLLLEDINGDNTTNKLLDLVENDESEQVRNNAVLVLLDRDDAIPTEILLRIANDPTASTRIRAEIINDMDDWEEGAALTALAAILNGESDPRLVKEAAETLVDIGTPLATNVLLDSYDDIANLDSQHVILEELGDLETPEVINFLSSIALNASSDDTAAIAIDSISEREDNIAVAALENIYFSTTNPQRRLATIDGIGDAETERAVEVLSRMLDDAATPQLQAEILYALGDTDRESAVAIALAAYRSSDDELVLRAAIRALDRLDEYDSATDAMLEILEQRLNAELGQ